MLAHHPCLRWLVTFKPHLEHVEGLELDAAGLVLEQHHHLHEVGHLGDEANHDLDVAPVQQHLAQQLMRRGGGRGKISRLVVIVAKAIMPGSKDDSLFKLVTTDLERLPSRDVVTGLQKLHVGTEKLQYQW